MRHPDVFPCFHLTSRRVPAVFIFIFKPFSPSRSHAPFHGSRSSSIILAPYTFFFYSAPISLLTYSSDTPLDAYLYSRVKPYRTHRRLDAGGRSLGFIDGSYHTRDPLFYSLLLPFFRVLEFVLFAPERDAMIIGWKDNKFEDMAQSRSNLNSRLFSGDSLYIFIYFSPRGGGMNM